MTYKCLCVFQIDTPSVTVREGGSTEYISITSNVPPIYLCNSNPYTGTLDEVCNFLFVAMKTLYMENNVFSKFALCCWCCADCPTKCAFKFHYYETRKSKYYSKW